MAKSIEDIKKEINDQLSTPAVDPGVQPSPQENSANSQPKPQGK